MELQLERLASHRDGRLSAAQQQTLRGLSSAMTRLYATIEAVLQQAQLDYGVLRPHPRQFDVLREASGLADTLRPLAERRGLKVRVSCDRGHAPRLENAATYLGWTANPWVLTMRGFTDAIDPPVFGWGLGLAALWLAGAFVPALRERGWLHAGALYAAFILPVLPLEKHTYHYYLYGALAGAGLAVAALIDAASTWMAGGTGSVSPARRAARKPARAPHAAVAPALGALAALVFFLNGHFTARKIETQPFGHPELRAEPIVDRARIATQVRNAVEAAALPPGTTLLFYSPEARAMAPASNPSRET
jgi:hypothetical protein